MQLAWHEAHGRPSHGGAGSLCFGCKTTPGLFPRIDDRRAEHTPRYFARFVSAFPRIAARQAETGPFAALVFATLHGLKAMRLFLPGETATR
ncbi:hypothetical protein [Bordetella trematum]|uniref:hypothetical protein n=1 Tax=Bordetella trematum TaxID=123899 RepID=UPI000D9565FB|nr:hypothetical protein [Bordetella trematum]SPU50269.1 Uncharacterised protein [Bordetella trematum]VDH08014.1 Uncharacterised protein [Bordetella trematum]